MSSTSERGEKRSDDAMHFFFLFDLSFFLFKITRPSNSFEFSKLLVTNSEHDFLPGNFLFVRLQIKNYFRIILVIIFPHMVTSFELASGLVFS